MSWRALFAGWLVYVAGLLAPLALAGKWIDWRLEVEFIPLVVRIAVWSTPCVSGFVAIAIARKEPLRHALSLGLACAVSAGALGVFLLHGHRLPCSPSVLGALSYALPLPLVLLGALLGHVSLGRAA